MICTVQLIVHLYSLLLNFTVAPGTWACVVCSDGFWSLAVDHIRLINADWSRILPPTTQKRKKKQRNKNKKGFHILHSVYAYICFYSQSKNIQVVPQHPPTHPPTHPHTHTHARTHTHTHAHTHARTHAHTHTHTHTHYSNKC